MIKNSILSQVLGRNFGSILLTIFLTLPFCGVAQTSKDQEKNIRRSQQLMSEAQYAIQHDKFTEGEAAYRKAISLDPKNNDAKYNLGTIYYQKGKNSEAMLRFKQAAHNATTKEEKHRAFHNLGNTFMNEKKYQEAVAAYKDALRNNPNDDETRYNLALAKELLEKNPPPPQDDENEDKQDQNQDKNNQQEQQDNQDQDNQDNQNKGDDGEDKEDKDKGEDKKDKGDENKDQPDKPKDEGDKPQQQQPVPGQLSPQQVKSLLEAMNNEEKKVQDKINAEKQKGVKVKSDKDW